MLDVDVLEAWLEGEYLEHPRNPMVLYVLLYPVKMHVNGEWVDGMAYQDCQDSTSDIYTRPLTEFEKFSVV